MIASSKVVPVPDMEALADVRREAPARYRSFSSVDKTSFDDSFIGGAQRCKSGIDYSWAPGTKKPAIKKAGSRQYEGTGLQIVEYKAQNQSQR